MTPQDYDAWLAGGKSSGTAEQNGERLFTDLACVTCHKPDSSGRGPSLLGVFGSKVDAHRRPQRRGRRELSA